MVGRGVLTPYLMKSPLYCHPPPFFKFCQPPPFLLPPTPTLPALSVVLFLWLDGWSRYITCTILLNDIMDLQMPSVGTLVPEGPWCVLCNKTSSLPSWHIMWLFAGTVIWYHTPHTKTHKDTQHTQGQVDVHAHISIYLGHPIYAHSSYLYYTEWIVKNYFSECSFFSKIIHLDVPIMFATYLNLYLNHLFIEYVLEHL